MFRLKPEYKPARHAPRKVPVHLEESFKQQIDSLVELGNSKLYQYTPLL